MRKKTLHKALNLSVATSKMVTQKIVVDSYRVLRRRFFKIIVIGTFVIVLGLLFVLNIFFRQSKINDLANGIIKDVFDTEVASVSFDEEKTRYTFPKIDGTGSIELFDLNVRSKTQKYDFLHVPHIIIHYDLLGLANNAPASRVEMPEGLSTVLNLDADGSWVDDGIFKESTDEPSEVVIPEIIVRNALIRVRAPTFLAELPKGMYEAYDSALKDKVPAYKEFTYQNEHGQFLSYVDVFLLRNPDNSEEMNLKGRCNCSLWGKSSFKGVFDQSFDNVDVHFVKLGQDLTSDFIGRFSGPVAKVLDTVLAEEEGVRNQANIHAHMRSTPTGKFELSSELSINGSMMFRAVPLLCSDVNANLSFDGKDLRIKDTVARRGAGKIRVDGIIKDVGTDNESLNLDIQGRGLAITDDLRRALAGETQDGKTTYPEWEMYKRKGNTVKPEVPPIFASVVRQFHPSGMIDVDVNVTSKWKGLNDERRKVDDIGLKITIIDATGAFLGDDRDLADSAAKSSQPSTFSDNSAHRSTKRLSDPLPSQEPARSDPIAGVPLPLFNITGVIETLEGNGNRKIFRIRGLDESERANIFKATGLDLPASPRGLVAHRGDGHGRIYVDGTIKNAVSKVQDDSETTLKISTQNMILNRELTSFLPPQAQEALLPFRPRGPIDISDSKISITPRSNSLRFQVFANRLLAQYRLGDATNPLKLNELRGTVHIDALGNIRLEELQGNVLNSPFTFGLKINAGRPLQRTEFSAKIEEIELNEELFSYLPSSMAGLRKLFTDPTSGDQQLSGKIDVEFQSVLSAPNQSDRTRVLLHLRNGVIGLNALSPFVLKNVDASLYVVAREGGIELQIVSLKGQPDNGNNTDETINISGSLFIPTNEDQDIKYNVLINAENVLLNEKIRLAADRLLREKDGEESTLARVWKDMQYDSQGTPLGRADIKASLAGAIGKNSQAPSHYNFDVLLKHCSIRYENFSLPLKEVTGRILVTGNASSELPSVSFLGFHAEAPQGEVEFSNLLFERGAEKAEDSKFSITIAARQLPLNDDLRKAFPPEFRGIYDSLDPTDRTKRLKDQKPRKGLINLDVTLTISGDNRFNYVGDVEFVEADLELGVAFTQCNGFLSCKGVLWGDEGEGYTNHSLYEGSVKFDKAQWKGVTFTNVTSSAQFAGNRFTLPNVRGEIHEGIIEGSMWFDFSNEEKNYLGIFNASRVSLESLSIALAGAQDPDPEKTLRGGLDAEILFFPERDNGLMGKGRIDVGRIPLKPEELKYIESVPPEERKGRPGSLGKVPLFGGLYDSLDVGSSGHFDEAHLIFHLHHDRMKIRELELISDALRVESVGGINPENDDTWAGGKESSFFAADPSDDTNYILYKEDENGKQVDITLIPTFAPRLPTFPVVQLLIDAIKGVVARIDITGPMTAPEIGLNSRTRERNNRDLGDVGPERSELK